MTRANTERPTGAHGMERPKAGGEHHDALESGLPKDVRSQGAGTANEGVGYKPAGHESVTEKGEYPGPGEGSHKGAAGPMPSSARAQGVPARNATGDGRGGSGRFKGTMGEGARGDPENISRAKGTMGNC